MTTVSISVLKARLSEYLDKVRRGEEVIITDRGQPVARLLSVQVSESRKDRRARLISEGVLSPAGKRRRRLTPPPGRKPSGVLAALLSERAEGR